MLILCSTNPKKFVNIYLMSQIKDILRSDSLLEDIIKNKKEEVIEIIYSGYDWLGEYDFYQHHSHQQGVLAREILTDEEWVERNFEKFTKENKEIILEKLMDEDEFYELAEEEDLAI